ncbi:hypothetical protein AB0269_07000 [Microbacterium sp. NPDC077644]|uniref:hypothetical protein n=1 Tax=Microbacterium sp. NPDC077644 TaxID=3155055 RepID=UPI00344B14A1
MGHDERMPLLLADRAHLTPPQRLYTYDELRGSGADPSERGWRRLRKGVYVEQSAYAALKPWERYATRVHALLKVQPSAVLCLEAAALIHGIPLFGETKDVHVYEPDATSSWRHGDVSIHASADEREVVEVAGIHVTSVTDTVADLARVVPPAQALAMVDAVISPVQGGTLRLDELRAHGADQQNRRGLKRRHWVWRNADARSESPGESVSRAVILWSGFEPPDLQRDFFYEGCNDRTDFHFPRTRAVAESDGWGKYDLDDPVAAEMHLREEKKREDRLRRNGHPMARWDLSDAWRVDPLCRALVQAGVRRAESPNIPYLATLHHTPRQLPARRRRPETGPAR